MFLEPLVTIQNLEKISTFDATEYKTPSGSIVLMWCYCSFVHMNYQRSLIASGEGNRLNEIRRKPKHRRRSSLMDLLQCNTTAMLEADSRVLPLGSR